MTATHRSTARRRMIRKASSESVGTALGMVGDDITVRLEKLEGAVNA